LQGDCRAPAVEPGGGATGWRFALGGMRGISGSLCTGVVEIKVVVSDGRIGRIEAM